MTLSLLERKSRASWLFDHTAETVGYSIAEKLKRHLVACDNPGRENRNLARLFQLIRIVGFADDIDVMVDKIDLVAGPNFLALAGFDFTIDTDQPVGDGLLGIATAVGEAFELQYFVEFDKLGLELSDDVFGITHIYSLDLLG